MGITLDKIAGFDILAKDIKINQVSPKPFGGQNPDGTVPAFEIEVH